VILVLAVMIRLLGGIFGATPQRSSYKDLMAAPDKPITLAAPLTDSAMQAALASVKASHGGVLGASSGARLTFRTAEGTLTLSTTELNDVNARYRAIKESLSSAASF
jgi:hypothetical protein